MCGQNVVLAMQKRLNLPFGMVSDVGPRNYRLDRRAHWRHLASTVERLCAGTMSWSATNSGNMASSLITLAILFFSHYYYDSFHIGKHKAMVWCLSVCLSYLFLTS